MNCKKGDLAVIVQSTADNLGKIVRCVRLATAEEAAVHSVRCFDFDHGPVWILGTVLKHSDGVRRPFCADAKLRPLRDSDGQDEMLRIAGLPQKVTA